MKSENEALKAAMEALVQSHNEQCAALKNNEQTLRGQVNEAKNRESEAAKQWKAQKAALEYRIVHLVRSLNAAQEERNSLRDELTKIEETQHLPPQSQQKSTQDAVEPEQAIADSKDVKELLPSSFDASEADHLMHAEQQNHVVAAKAVQMNEQLEPTMDAKRVDVDMKQEQEKRAVAEKEARVNEQLEHTMNAKQVDVLMKEDQEECTAVGQTVSVNEELEGTTSAKYAEELVAPEREQRVHSSESQREVSAAWSEEASLRAKQQQVELHNELEHTPDRNKDSAPASAACVEDGSNSKPTKSQRQSQLSKLEDDSACLEPPTNMKGAVSPREDSAGQRGTTADTKVEKQQEMKTQSSDKPIQSHQQIQKQENEQPEMARKPDMKQVHPAQQSKEQEEGNKQPQQAQRNRSGSNGQQLTRNQRKRQRRKQNRRGRGK